MEKWRKYSKPEKETLGKEGRKVPKQKTEQKKRGRKRIPNRTLLTISHVFHVSATDVQDQAKTLKNMYDIPS